MATLKLLTIRTTEREEEHYSSQRQTQLSQQAARVGNAYLGTPTQAQPKSSRVPEHISSAPKKKDAKLVFTPGVLSALRPDNGSSNTSAEQMDTPTNQAATETNLEPTMENIIAEMQKVHDMFTQKVIRSKQKTEVRDIMAWVIDQIKAMGNEVKKTPTQQERQQPSEENINLGQVMAELAEIRKAMKQTYSQVAQGATTKDTPATTKEGEAHNDCATAHKCKANHAHATAHQERQPSEEQQDKARSEQAKQDVILTTRDAKDDAQKKVGN